MKIQTVTYSRLVSGPGYSNQTIGATANVDEDEAPENALAALEVWVQNQHTLRRETADDLYQSQQEVWQARSDLSHLKDQIRQATERLATVKAIGEKMGIDVTERLGPEIDLDDVPF